VATGRRVRAGARRTRSGWARGEPVSEERRGVALRLREELAGAQDRLLRLQAEFENFRKRALRERQEAAQYGSQNLFKELVSVVDNLERAIAHARESGGGDLASFLQGVELVQRELLSIFEKNHVTEIEALGKPFDPSLHEAMAQGDGAVPPNTVIEVLQKGSSYAIACATDASSDQGAGSGERWEERRPTPALSPPSAGNVIGSTSGPRTLRRAVENGQTQVIANSEMATTSMVAFSPA
jgi:molecular chaperone GrpE